MLTDDQRTKLFAAFDAMVLNNGADGFNAAHFIREVVAVGFPSGPEMYAACRALAEHAADLGRSGVIAVIGATERGVASCYLTPFGERVLSRREPSPHDATGYVGALRAITAEPDRIVMQYAAEASAAWRANLPRASAVLLGCACERLIILLGEAVVAAAIVPFDAKLRGMLATYTPIATVFEQVRAALTSKPFRVGQDGLERRLVSIFEHVRGLRNQAGHPSGDEISMTDAHAGLLLFPEFHAGVVKLIAALALAS